jgi:hypothetical protein
LLQLRRDLIQLLRFEAENHQPRHCPRCVEAGEHAHSLDRTPARPECNDGREIDTGEAPAFDKCAGHIAAADEPCGVRNQV